MHNSAQGSENQTTATIVKDSWSIICIWGVLSTQPTGGHRSVPEALISILSMLTRIMQLGRDELGLEYGDEKKLIYQSYRTADDQASVAADVENFLPRAP